MFLLLTSLLATGYSIAVGDACQSTDECAGLSICQAPLVGTNLCTCMDILGTMCCSLDTTCQTNAANAFVQITFDDVLAGVTDGLYALEEGTLLTIDSNTDVNNLISIAFETAASATENAVIDIEANIEAAFTEFDIRQAASAEVSLAAGASLDLNALLLETQGSLDLSFEQSAVVSTGSITINLGAELDVNGDGTFQASGSFDLSGTFSLDFAALPVSLSGIEAIAETGNIEIVFPSSTDWEAHVNNFDVFIVASFDSVVAGAVNAGATVTIVDADGNTLIEHRMSVATTRRRLAEVGCGEAVWDEVSGSFKVSTCEASVAPALATPTFGIILTLLSSLLAFW